MLLQCHTQQLQHDVPTQPCTCLQGQQIRQQKQAAVTQQKQEQGLIQALRAPTLTHALLKGCLAKFDGAVDVAYETAGAITGVYEGLKIGFTSSISQVNLHIVCYCGIYLSYDMLVSSETLSSSQHGGTEL